MANFYTILTTVSHWVENRSNTVRIYFAPLRETFFLTTVLLS